jgi:hypothetical protein
MLSRYSEEVMEERVLPVDLREAEAGVQAVLQLVAMQVLQLLVPVIPREVMGVPVLVKTIMAIMVQLMVEAELEVRQLMVVQREMEVMAETAMYWLPIPVLPMGLPA